MNSAEFFENQPQFIERRGWSFVEYSPEMVVHLYHSWKKCFPNPKVNPGVKQAYEQGLSLLEICRDDYDNPHYIPVVPDLNIDALKKQWCLDYCYSHHLLPRSKSRDKNSNSRAPVADSNPKGEDSQ